MWQRPPIRHVWLACLLSAGLPCALQAVEPQDLTVPSTAPFYTAASIVQAATQQPATLAPNTIATIYGTNLAYDTHAVTAGDFTRGELPTAVDGVTVLVYGIPCGLFYVSPGQINFLVPYEVTAANVNVQVVRQGVNGPIVTIPLAATSPAFFEWNGNQAIAVHTDGTLISAASPAQAGEVIVLFAAGLGRTSPDQEPNAPPTVAAKLLYAAQLQILLNGVALPAASVLYAGVTPGFAGLYQINLQLPDPLPESPTIQVTIGAQSSPPAIVLPAR